ncbi:MAG: hypothetical protein CBD18_06495 [Opitutales bacterium TMED158]|nr:MAG: hypothetical protein CBD18_06495 [Opitutales bacterium TMED158]
MSCAERVELRNSRTVDSIPEKPLELHEAPLRKEEVLFRCRRNARRYIAKVDSQGNVVVTVPRGGTKRGAWAFLKEHEKWLRQQRRRALEQLASRKLLAGDWIWFRGQRETLEVIKDWGRPVLLCGKERIFLADEAMELGGPLSTHLRSLAKRELTELARELAGRFEIDISRVIIRDQQTRWGSCSESGTISLNWRLILAPQETVEYIVIHELMHRREMNHSTAFWTLVEAACPRYKDHEKWLHDHRLELSW